MCNAFVYIFRFARDVILVYEFELNKQSAQLKNSFYQKKRKKEAKKTQRQRRAILKEKKFKIAQLASFLSRCFNTKNRLYILHG